MQLAENRIATTTVSRVRFRSTMCVPPWDAGVKPMPPKPTSRPECMRMSTSSAMDTSTCQTARIASAIGPGYQRFRRFLGGGFGVDGVQELFPDIGLEHDAFHPVPAGFVSGRRGHDPDSRGGAALPGPIAGLAASRPGHRLAQ